jgi:phosphodiesterase/alkaline phosphatase D-like protein
MNRNLKLLGVGAIVVAVAAGVALAASSPAVSTHAATSITTSSAVLNGTINPNGATTTYHFEYGLTKSYGESTPTRSAGNGTKSVAVKATVRSLLPGTVYHFRLTASNRFGNAGGIDRTFRTAGNPPPDAATGPAAQIGRNGATLTAVINPHGENTKWDFQYGLTTSYGVQTFGGTVPAGQSAVTVSEQLKGLQSGTTFHYRIVALHGLTIVKYGADGTFVTLPSRRRSPRVVAKTIPARAKTAPYNFTTAGRLIVPRSIPSSVGCSGDISAAFFNGRRQVAYTLLPIQPNCSFSGRTTFRHLPGRGPRHRTVRLRVVAQFHGNPYVAPRTARRESVVLG